MKIELQDIPDIEHIYPEPPKWKVKTCNLVGVGNLVLMRLDQWESDPKYREEYYQMISNIAITACSEKIEVDTPHVKKNHDPEHGEVYEFRSYDDEKERAGKARILFFYDENGGNLILCTNAFEKGTGDQNMSFKQCASLKKLYYQQRSEQ